MFPQFDKNINLRVQDICKPKQNKHNEMHLGAPYSVPKPQITKKYVSQCEEPARHLHENGVAFSEAPDSRRLYLQRQNWDFKELKENKWSIQT